MVLEMNVVPKRGLRAVGEDVIAFADIFGDKTNKNLQLNKKVSALAFKMSPVRGYQIKGTFLGFQIICWLVHLLLFGSNEVGKH